MKTYGQIIAEIEELPHYREFICQVCGNKQQVYILEIQGNCEKCQNRHKFRGFESLGSEIEDVIDTVLSWLGAGDDFSAAMRRKQAIDMASMLDTELDSGE